MQRLTLFVFVTLQLVGCSPRRDITGDPRRAVKPTGNAVLGEREEENIVLLAVDASPSFQKRIADGGSQFAMRVVEKFFRDRAGSQDKLVIARLSGDGERALAWEGTALQLRMQHPTPSSFRDFLMGKADSKEAQIHKGLRHAVQYILSDPRIANGRAKVAVIVLSSMIDHTEADLDNREAGYLRHELNQIGWRGGAVGFYGVDQSRLLYWRRELADLGVKNFRVESEIVGDPPIPSFDE